jgi:hypothetical protein
MPSRRPSGFHLTRSHTVRAAAGIFERTSSAHRRGDPSPPRRVEPIVAEVVDALAACTAVELRGTTRPRGGAARSTFSRAFGPGSCVQTLLARVSINPVAGHSLWQVADEPLSAPSSPPYGSYLARLSRMLTSVSQASRIAETGTATYRETAALPLSYLGTGFTLRYSCRHGIVPSPVWDRSNS